MTRKEKVAQIYPECVGYGYTGGVAGCPDEYPFLGTHGFNLTECARNTRWKDPEPRPRRPKWQQDIMNKFMKIV